MSKLNLNKPLSVLGRTAAVIHKFSSTRVAVLVEGEQIIRNFHRVESWPTDKWQDISTPGVELVNKPVLTIKYVAFYPQTGSVYAHGDKPLKTSSYGLDQIVQVKLTYDGDVLIAKEIV